jgi:uncharacterized protein (TIGR03790 family)
VHVSHIRRWSHVLFLLALVGLPGRPALGLEADELLLVVNRNMPASSDLAAFYAQARGVPEGHIVALDLPETEDISFDRFERDAVPVIRAFLRDNGLREKVRCLVTFYGVPFRITGHVPTPEEKAELSGLQRRLTAITAQIEPAVKKAEELAARVDASFKAQTGQDLSGLGRRADAAIQAVVRTAMSKPPPQTEKLLAELLPIINELAGPAAVARHFKDQAIARIAPAEEAARWPQRREQVEQAARSLAELEDRRFDPDARRRVIESAGEFLGLFGLARAVQGQIQYLDNDATASAVDSDLALLWWGYYPRSAWLINPLNHKTPLATPPVLMVARLDAPRPQTVREMIVASLKAERDGLSGQAVIDSRGLEKPATTKRSRSRAEPAVPGRDEDAFAAYDQSLRGLAGIIAGKTKLPLTHEQTSEVLALGSVKPPTALYCGWYSVRNYIAAMKFSRGAVGFHVASFEMISLRTPGEKGWVAGLLDDGVVATIGPVAEPYLMAFPKADEFFPALLTGRPTLAEVYWATSPTVSWMMCLIGDPLYRPFAANPQLSISDLPESLRRALSPTTKPSTRAR